MNTRQEQRLDVEGFKAGTGSLEPLGFGGAGSREEWAMPWGREVELGMQDQDVRASFSRRWEPLEVLSEKITGPVLCGGSISEAAWGMKRGTQDHRRLVPGPS